MMKKLLVLLIGLLLFAAACAEPVSLAGGWTPADSPEITEDRQAVFDKGMQSLLGVRYEPVAYLGSQVVAGMNHCFLCKTQLVYPDAASAYALVYLYENLNGAVTILSIVPFDFGALCDLGAAE